MRFLVFSDVHGNRRAVDIAARLAEKEGANITIFLGDISSGKTMGMAGPNLEDADYLANKFGGKELYTLFGNCDVAEVRDFYEDNGLGLHNRTVGVKGLTIIGIGGSNPTPFHTPSEFTEIEIKGTLEALFKKAARFETERVFLISHFPPKNTNCDVVGGGEHVGSEALREVIEKHQPNLCICGHIHEAKAEDFIQKTRVINVGPASDGNFMTIDVDGDVRITGIKI